MSRRLLLFALGLVALVLLYNLNTATKNLLLRFTDTLKREVVTIQEAVLDYFDLHFEQVDTIKKLKEENAKLERYRLLYEVLRKDLQHIERQCRVDIPFRYSLRLVRVLSYVNFADFSAVWLDTKLSGRKLAGLLSEENVAGIAIEDQGRTKGLLNGNYKCSYGVKVGAGANGVAMGSGDNRFVIVRYIPNYEPIKVGDIVKTNGLDGIFAEGLRVGVVVQIRQEGSYKVAKVRTFANLDSPRYLWLMKL